MKRTALVLCLALVLLAVAAGAGCGGKTDPLVGDWKAQDTTVDISFHVAAPSGGVYTVTWANPSQAAAATPDPSVPTVPPVVTFQMNRKSDTIYSDDQGTTFILVGGSVVSVKYPGGDGSTQQRNFVRAN
jgi:hypothetical protein